jgi:tRNA (uracil-5-)-methyltransferase
MLVTTCNHACTPSLSSNPPASVTIKTPLSRTPASVFQQGRLPTTPPPPTHALQVIATEVSKASVEAARFNLTANGAENVFIARMAAHEFTETWKSKGTRNRLKGMTPWDELELRTLLVDPPRAGLDDESRQLLGDFSNVVYISCNPETLARDMGAVAATHRVARFAVFDQFPYTDHVECGAYLVWR